MSALIPRTYWYLRHGQTDWNLQGLAQGHTDIPLNDTGLEQARQAGALLATLFDNDARPFDHIVASPLTRALVTAEHARDCICRRHGLDLPLSTDPDLKEVCFGVLEGHPMHNWYEPWIHENYQPEGAEAFNALKHRAIRATNAALNAGTPLLVAHGALFRGLRAGMGLEIDVRLPNATPLRLDNIHSGWTVTAFHHTDEKTPL